MFIMKYFNILAILLFSLALSFQACNNDKSDSTQETTTLPAPPSSVNPNTPVTATPSPTESPAQNAAGVWHYTCSKGCAGGAGAAGVCSTCGGPLAHNQAYHSTPNAPTTTTTTTTSPLTTTPPAATNPNPSPAQNAAGVWHYTCSKGCPGGAGAAGTCGSCGGALAHNQAYHN